MNSLGKISLSTLQYLGGVEFDYAGGKSSLSTNQGESTRSMTYYVDAGNVNEQIKSIPTTCPQDATLTRLLSVRGKSGGAKGIIEVTATWGTAERFPGDYSGGGGERPDGTIEQSTTSSSRMVPIDDKGLTDNGLYTQQEINSLKARGYRALPVGSTRYTYVYYEKDFSWTEGALIGYVGNTGVPMGLTDADGSKWMLIEEAITATSPEQVRIQQVYEYSAGGWFGKT